jgi:hypothetical protein
VSLTGHSEQRGVLSTSRPWIGSSLTPPAPVRTGGVLRPCDCSDWRFVTPGRMPLYFFDTTDTGLSHTDDEGIELDGLEIARQEALAMLGGIARDELPDGDAREFVVRIRDEAGSVLLTASLVLRVER